MLRATDVIAKGDWDAAAESVVLDFDDRHRRRVSMETVSGQKFLLDLAEPVALRSGDALQLEDGRLIEVIGAPETLAEVKAENAEHLLRMAWHLGNRHLPVQIAGGKIRFRRDHVIEGMVSVLGGSVRMVQAPFDPEGGAYAQAKRKAHDHEHHAGCGCGHDHAHGHDHHHGHHHHGEGCCGGHDHAHHAHGEECCGHDHHHGPTDHSQSDEHGHSHGKTDLHNHGACCGGHHHGHKHD